ncbi:MAG: hypothetical protein HY683_00485 [Chloroflexi bacterium]|nr:hypothetical protein [Chloroflexota bacterium]
MIRQKRGTNLLRSLGPSIVVSILVIALFATYAVSGRGSKHVDLSDDLDGTPGKQPPAQTTVSSAAMALSTSGPSGAIFTTLEDGTVVNANIYADKRDVYLDGGPPQNAPSTSAALDPGNYYFQVTDPSGKSLLSQDPVKCREVHINSSGVIDQYVSSGRTYPGKGNSVVVCSKDGKTAGKHDTGVDADHAAEGAITVQLMPYANTPNRGGVYKTWITRIEDFAGDPEQVDNPCGSGCFHGFVPARSKTDNFKVKGQDKIVPPTLTVLKWYDFDHDGVDEIGTGANEVSLTGWMVSVTDPLGVVRTVFTPATINPADEGTYSLCEGMPIESGWMSTTATCAMVTVANGQNVVVEFGNVFQRPFVGGLTIGYWKTHTSLGPATPRDPTYDRLPILLGIASNGITAPEVNVADEATAVAVLTVAQEGCSGDCLAQLKAQLLAAKLNALAFAGFYDATFGLGGPTVGSVIDAADRLLDDVANGRITGDANIKAVAEPLKTKLDMANNNSHSAVLFEYSPVPGPYSFAS